MLGTLKSFEIWQIEKKSEGCNQKYVKELEDLNAHKENVLAIVSHDLRVLSGIIGTAEYLKANLNRRNLM
jgi:two-component system CheB/CheR fusion protein